MEDLIGREQETRLLKRLYCSKKAEFLAIYGRRRVGKTFLITRYFKDKGVFFEITGSPNASSQEQILNFHREFCSLFKQEDHNRPPKDWSEAFHQLITTLQKMKIKQKVVLFFDELPWLCSRKSGFLSALDYAWNRHLSRMSNVFLVVSGSAASWMIHHVVNNTGGLYGRLSAHLRLLPFSLTEVEKYLLSRDIHLPKKQICEIYMVSGGVPKYLTFIERGMSAGQIIDALCFKSQAPLLTEFHKLYHSLFRHPEVHIEIVKALAKQRRGLQRKDLLEEAKIPSSGRVSAIIRELEESGFVMSLPEIGKTSREVRYYLSDEYSLFYLNWIDPVKSTLLQVVEKDYWLKQQATPSWRIWAGFAFEGLCLKHVGKIKEALGISAVNTSANWWQSTTEGKKEAEVDLVIDRADQSMNLCEIKFHSGTFEMTKAYAKSLERKKELFRERTKTNKALFTTLITPFGCKENDSYISAVENQLKIEDLF